MRVVSSMYVRLEYHTHNTTQKHTHTHTHAWSSVPSRHQIATHCDRDGIGRAPAEMDSLLELEAHELHPKCSQAPQDECDR